MNNFIFKSPKGLIKNSSEYLVNLMLRQFEIVKKEQRMARSDLQTINQKLDRLLVDKHLQMQVDSYFDDEQVNEETSPQTELEDK